MVWLYVLFLIIVFIVFVLQAIWVEYLDDGLQKSWAYRLFKFFQYGFRQDLNNVYDGKTKEQYQKEANRVVEEVVSTAQSGKNYGTIRLSPEFNDKDTEIIIEMMLKDLHKRFTNVFSTSTYYSNCKGCNCIIVSWR